MKPTPSDSQPPRFEEIELKLALPTSDPASLVMRLARTPVLARRQATQAQLHSIYYDTPDQILRQQRTALRVRRIGNGAHPQWVQTLKTGGNDDSALSQRGEWESSVTDASVSFSALKDTPWANLDPDGTLFLSLTPCFVTSFERTSWLVRQRDGSVVEVALDIGQIEAGDQQTPLCELELELKAGQPAALFKIARQIARSITVLPCTMSKAERGFALAHNLLNRPVHARVPTLTPKQALPETARYVLREMFHQFTANLNALRSSDDPELVHQARIGWRRFKSAKRLFSPVLARDLQPSWQALEVLLSALGSLRDLDVARTETLPPLMDSYTAGETRRTHAWQTMTQALAEACDHQRQVVRDALQAPLVGASLLATTQWLENAATLPKAAAAQNTLKTRPLRAWAKQRVLRLHTQLQAALHQADTPEHQHRIRILAKRLRYSIEVLHALLPQRQAKQWHHQASQLQLSLGTTRDVLQASRLLATWDTTQELAEFLRGFALGQTTLQHSFNQI